MPESDAQNVSGQVLAGAEIPEGGGEGPYLSMATLKLQALVYDILPSRKVPESDARSVRLASSSPSERKRRAPQAHAVC